MNIQQFVLVEFSPIFKEAFATSLLVETKDNNEIDHFYKALSVHAFDFISSDTIEFVVDDEGLLDENNPVFYVQSDGYKFNIVGNFIIGKRIETDEGCVVVGFDSEEELATYLKNAELVVKYIGTVKELELEPKIEFVEIDF